MRHSPSSTSAPLIVRAAHAADATTVVAMIGELAEFHSDVTRVSLEQFRLDAFGFQPWFSVLVAEQDGNLIGYAILNRLYKAQAGERGLDLHHLYVRKGERGRGVGTLLVSAAIGHAKALGCAFLTLGVRPDNAQAQAFYAGLGFEDAASRNLRLKLPLAA